MEASSPEALKGLVSTGIGFSIMSRSTVSSELRNGSLVCVPLAPPLLRNLSVVYPKERMQSKLVSAFLQFAKQELAAERSTPARSDAPRMAINARIMDGLDWAKVRVRLFDGADTWKYLDE